MFIHITLHVRLLTLKPHEPPKGRYKSLLLFELNTTQNLFTMEAEESCGNLDTHFQRTEGTVTRSDHDYMYDSYQLRYKLVSSPVVISAPEQL